jgi:hypothetical protein
MAEEEATQRHTGEFATPSAHHRASSQDNTTSDDTPPHKQQTPSLSWLSMLERIADLTFDLALRGVCLWGAIVGYLRTGNGLFFLLCIGVARKELGILTAIQALLGSIGWIKQTKHPDPPPDEQPNLPGTVS